MIAGEGTELIHRAARDIHEFVLDPEQYKKAEGDTPREVLRLKLLLEAGPHLEAHGGAR